MSANVCFEMDGRMHYVEVPQANGFEVTDVGLVLRTSSWCGNKVALFTSWFYVTITPDRGPDGRFIKRNP